MENQLPKPRSCPLCGGVEFADEKMYGSGGIGFLPEGGSGWRSIFPKLELVRAMKCKSCGYFFQFAGRPSI